MRPVIVLGCLASLLYGVDPREIVRRTVDLDRRNTQLSSSYTFLQRQVVRELDRSGKLKSQKDETWDITPLEGGIPVLVDGKIVGAIGVSGALSSQDAQVAKAGADALAR